MAFKRKLRARKPRRRAKRRSTRSMARVAKRVMLRNVETKRHLTTSGPPGLTDVVLLDNESRWVITNCMASVQGTEDEDIVGTQIHAVGLSLKIQFKYVNPYAPYFKLFVVQANPSLLGGSNTIFEALIGNGMLENIKKQYKVLKTITVNPMMRGIAGGGTQAIPPIHRRIWVPLKKKYDYRDNTTAQGIHKNIAIVAIAYHDGIPTTEVGVVSVYSTLYYKDP